MLQYNEEWIQFIRLKYIVKIHSNTKYIWNIGNTNSDLVFFLLLNSIIQEHWIYKKQIACSANEESFAYRKIEWLSCEHVDLKSND